MEAPSDVLFWTPAQREAAFRAMDRITPHHVVSKGTLTRALPPGVALDFDPEPFMQAHKTAGLLVLQDGKIRLERYGLGFDQDGRWTSFSVAKSVTSTLVGAAIQQGLIESLDTPITRYLPELGGSAYDGVSVRQLLTMTSGVQWNEDYEDPNSDVARFFGERDVPAGVDPTLDYMRRLPRAAEPGTRWHYSTGETSLVGVLVSRATGQSLAQFLSETLWKPYGFERDGAWMVDESGQEPGGCCLVASLRDWGRVGQFILDGGVIDGRAVMPKDWFKQATSTQADVGIAGRGYGFQWWTFDDGHFEARGIFGQMIYFEPSQRLVVVLLSAWPTASSQAEVTARDELLAQIRAAVTHH
ncbi:MAG TPA: serine hydrolase [Chiayiivirga sp.]|nr:serine hydrolase [Chiayiivirga sp.]